MSARVPAETRLVRLVLAGVIALIAVAACTSSSSGGNGGSDAGGLPEAAMCAMPGGPVQGPLDTHCVVNGMPVVQTTNQADCDALGDAGTGDDGSTSADGSSGPDGSADDGGSAANEGGPDADIGNCGDPGYLAAEFGSAGTDDDCKYDISWTSTPVCEGNVYFNVTVKNRTDGSPVRGANVRPDVVLDCSHPISNSPADPSPEVAPGTYVVGPILFDAPGRWVVRFHVFFNCYHLVPDSPHGHAAFWVQVP